MERNFQGNSCKWRVLMLKLQCFTCTLFIGKWMLTYYYQISMFGETSNQYENLNKTFKFWLIYIYCVFIKFIFIFSVIKIHWYFNMIRIHSYVFPYNKFIKNQKINNICYNYFYLLVQINYQHCDAIFKKWFLCSVICKSKTKWRFSFQNYFLIIDRNIY